jgi:DNA-binding helix-hairpin-helix protein with protein kinase domain
MTRRDVVLNGTVVKLADEPLKGGGQAAVYPVLDHNEAVVKLYREPPGAAQERRLERMLTMAPLGGRPTHETQPPELAWPTALARDCGGDFLGYAMPRFGEPEHVQLVGLFTRSLRMRLFPGRGDWKFLLGVSWNLAFMTARLHHEKLVIGDFSSNNVVVDQAGFVTFLDCDSIAFTDPTTGEYFPCLMHTADYSAPERQKGGPASPESDNFALAVLIYQLLTGGNHPFGGVPHESDSDATVKDNIAASCSYVVRPESVVVPRTVVDPLVLPPALLGLARRAFGPGVDDPAARPTAQEWLRVLDHERSRVQVCTARPLHTYGSHLDACPWCARVVTTGHDLFTVVSPRDPTVPRRDTQPRMAPRHRPAASAWGSREAVIAAIVIGVIVVLALIALAAG